jgi:dTDP-4-amino-4,6-dideoxygalactose transaminase
MDAKRNAHMHRVLASFENILILLWQSHLRIMYMRHINAYVQVNTAQLPEGWSRDRIMAEINALGVPCFSGSCSEVYLEKAFDGTPWRPEQRLVNAKSLGESSLMFLVHPTLSDSNMQKTVDSIQQVISQISM